MFDHDEAVKAIKATFAPPADRPVPNPEAEAAYLAARKIDDEGRTTWAIQAYQTFVEKFPTAVDCERAKARIEILRGSGKAAPKSSAPVGGGALKR